MVLEKGLASISRTDTPAHGFRSMDWFPLRMVVSKGAGVGVRREREVGVSRCQLLYVEWIHDTV